MTNLENEPLRVCRICGLTAESDKELELFAKKTNSKYNRANICKQCQSKEAMRYATKDIDKKRKSCRDWHRKHKEKMKSKRLKYYYGITLEEYNEMYTKQNGCCKICNKHRDSFSKDLAVDHCHTTGEIRGLLCANCNTALGLFYDDLDVLEKALEYLKGVSYGN